MKYTQFFSDVKAELKDAPTEVKESFNSLIKYFAVNPADLTEAKLGELPIGFLKLKYDSTFYNYGIWDKITSRSFSGKGKGGPTVKINKSILKDELLNLIADNQLSFEGIKRDYKAYLDSRSKPKDINSLIHNAETKRDKLPTLKIYNTWKYMMGKIGSTGKTFQTLKRTDNESDWIQKQGWEIHGVKWSEDKPIEKLPSWDALIYGNFDGSRYEWKMMPLQEIHDYFDSTENQTFEVYKV